MQLSKLFKCYWTLWINVLNKLRFILGAYIHLIHFSYRIFHVFTQCILGFSVIFYHKLHFDSRDWKMFELILLFKNIPDLDLDLRILWVLKEIWALFTGANKSKKHIDDKWYRFKSKKRFYIWKHMFFHPDTAIWFCVGHDSVPKRPPSNHCTGSWDFRLYYDHSELQLEISSIGNNFLLTLKEMCCGWELSKLYSPVILFCSLQTSPSLIHREQAWLLYRFIVRKEISIQLLQKVTHNPQVTRWEITGTKAEKKNYFTKLRQKATKMHWPAKRQSKISQTDFWFQPLNENKKWPVYMTHIGPLNGG